MMGLFFLFKNRMKPPPTKRQGEPVILTLLQFCSAEGGQGNSPTLMARI